MVDFKDSDAAQKVGPAPRKGVEARPEENVLAADARLEPVLCVPRSQAQTGAVLLTGALSVCGQLCGADVAPGGPHKWQRVRIIQDPRPLVVDAVRVSDDGDGHGCCACPCG